ncbi:MAG TPA: PilW family protein [Kofleriaceae bacterium]|nr:PilW family protein [Kofleriaceae bacterium]
MTAPRGFTLVELMISLVVFSLVVTGLLSVAVSLSGGMREQRAAMSADAAAQLTLFAIADALRQASPGAASGRIIDAATCTTDALTVTGSSTGPDQIDVIYATGGVVTSTRAAYTAGTTSLAITDASQLAAGDYVVISNLQQGHLVKITAVNGTTLTLASQCSPINLPSGGYPSGSLVIRAQHVAFSVGAVDGVPTMMMDADASGPGVAEPFAEGIEDLQVALGVDANGDGAITEVGAAPGDDEWQGNVAGDAALTGPIRAIRLTVVSRATGALAGVATPFRRPAAEDRAAATTFDGFRRRVLRSTIETRNLSGSP